MQGAPTGYQQGRNGRQCRNYWRTANLYYRDLDLILLRLARLLEDHGQEALPAPPMVAAAG